MDSLHCYFALGIDSIAFALCLRDYYRYKNTARAIRDSVNLELDVLDKDNDSKKYCAIRGTIRPIGVSLNSGEYLYNHCSILTKICVNFQR